MHYITRFLILGMLCTLLVLAVEADCSRKQCGWGYAQDGTENGSDSANSPGVLEPDLVNDWPMFGCDPAHTGYNAGQADGDYYVLAWEQDLEDLFDTTVKSLGQVAVANGVVFANVNPLFGDGGVIALNARDGREYWRCTIVDKYSSNPVSVADGTVFFQQCNNDGYAYLWALDALTGKKVWRVPFGAQWEEYYAPTVADGKVFINGGDFGGMYAFDAFDGTQLWFVDLPQYDSWTPAYGDAVVYSWVAGEFVAWDPEEGKELWSLDLGWGTTLHSMKRVAVIVGDTAYVVTESYTSSGDLVAIDLAHHVEKWRVSRDFVGTPSVADGAVYALDDRVVRAYDAATGDLLWSYDCDAQLMGAPVITADYVYVASDDETWVLDRQTHGLVWYTDRGGWLTVANDQLFIAEPNGWLAAYKMGSVIYLPIVYKGP